MVLRFYISLFRKRIVVGYLKQHLVWLWYSDKHARPLSYNLSMNTLFGVKRIENLKDVPILLGILNPL